MQVKIFGERHTGTNAMRTLVADNFGINAGNHGPLGWKHRRAPKKQELFKHNMDEMLFIMLVRNPYSWMDAMWQDPYNCHDPKGHQCSYDSYIRKPFEDYENLPACWSEKNMSYFDMKMIVPNGVIFRVEDMAEEPGYIFKELQEWLKPTSDVFIKPGYHNGRFAPALAHKKVAAVGNPVAASDETYNFAEPFLDSFLMEVFAYPQNRAKVSL